MLISISSYFGMSVHGMAWHGMAWHGTMKGEADALRYYGYV
jgi:hypothetical protein